MKTSPSKTAIFLLTALSFFAFFIFGGTDNLKGPTLPALIAELNLDYGSSGNIFLGVYIGFLVASLLAGVFADRFGLKVVFVSAGVILALGVGGYSFFNTPFLLSLSLFVVGFGMGGLELGATAVIVNLYHRQKGLYLNLLSVMHGLGSALAPIFVGYLLTAGFSWRVAYRWDLLFIALFFAASLALRFPQAEEKNSLDFRAVSKVAFKHSLPLYYAIILFYVSAEIGLSSWMVVYLKEMRGMSEAASANFLALFFGLIMLGRFIGGFLVRSVGYLRAISVAIFFAAASLSIGIFTQATFFIPLTGLFLSIIFPTLAAAVSDAEHKNTNTILGVAFAFSSFGGMVGPWLTAWTSNFFGLQAGFILLLFFAVLTFSLVFILEQKSRRENLVAQNN
ncbi:MAG: MFS transporter [Anaerolineales bacterium]|nr:MFS transporter [Anaerolineales bacterium]